MSYPPPGGTPDPYGQGGTPDPYGHGGTPDPYGQQQQPGYQDPYAPPGSPASGAPYGQPQSGAPYSGQPYSQPYPPYGAQVPGTNIMAILSLVFAFVFAPVGIVLGHIAKKQIQQSGEQGGGLATAGLILSYIFTGLAVLGCCAAIAIPLIAGSTTTY